MSTKATIYEPISHQMKGPLKLFSTKISPQLLIFQYSMGKFLMESNTLHGYRKLGAEICGGREDYEASECILINPNLK